MFDDEERRIISKSRYLSGLQCPKLIWYQFNAPDQIPPPDADKLAIFEQGHRVGDIAQELFPGGIFIQKGSWKIENVLADTRKIVRLRKPLYEAGFLFGNSYARVDILNPVNDDEWDLYEVKSGTRVKEVNFPDVAYQRYILEGTGMKIRSCNLVHINRDYVRRGDLEINELFTVDDMTETTGPLLSHIPVDLQWMAEKIREKDMPDIYIGRQCTTPFECAMIPVCWNYLPEHNVTTLYSDRARGFSLIEKDVTDIFDIPHDMDLTNKQKIQVDAVYTGKVHVEKKMVAGFLDRLIYPLHYIDFETIAPAVPIFDGTRPYRDIPFQFSVQVQTSADSVLEDFSFLAVGAGDPREEFILMLREAVGNEGSIIVYNASFEKRILERLSETFPDHSDWIEQLLVRVVDLLKPFQAFHIYHPGQHGSASLKNVTPALTGSGYEDLEISGGMTARNEFSRVTYSDVSEEERARVRSELIEYCRQDTVGMASIIRVMRELIK